MVAFEARTAQGLHTTDQAGRVLLRAGNVV